MFITENCGSFLFYSYQAHRYWDKSQDTTRHADPKRMENQARLCNE